MYEQIQDISRSPEWYRKILNLLWFFAAVAAVDEAVYVWLGYPQALNDLILEGAVMAAIVGGLELLSLSAKARSDYLLIGAGTLLASTIIAVHPQLPTAPATLLAPQFISILFFRKSRILFAAGMSILAFCILYAVMPGIRAVYGFDDAVDTVLIFLCSTILSYTVVSRGLEILHNLRQLHDAKQDLLVKTIIMDKLHKMDALTELYNHKTFHEYLEKLVEQSETNGLPLQLAVIDIDNFKKVNDTYGHWAGDNILMRVAAVLRGAVTPNDFVARYGGEEFAIIFTEKTLKQSYDILERIRCEIAGTTHEELGFKPVTVSIGLEDYKRGTGKESLFKNADASLYTAKKRGKNQVACSELATLSTQS